MVLHPCLKIVFDDKRARTFLTVEDLPWDETGPEDTDPYYVVIRSGRKEGEETVVQAAKQVLVQFARGETVSRWLPGHKRRLDAITRTYQLVRGSDPLFDIIFDKLPSEYRGTDVMFQLVILFRSAWQEALRDPLLVLSDISATSGDQTFHRARVALVWALEQDAFDIAPGAASTLGVEEMSHRLFSQIAPKGLDRLVVLARRRVARVDAPL